MIDSNILLITDDENVVNNVLSKLILLRENDKILVSDYKNSEKFLKHSDASVVILHKKEDDETTIKFIESIKSYDYEIVMLVDDCNAEFILRAYDTGITDYFTIESESYEILIKIVNCLKKQILKKSLLRNTDLLNEFELIESGTRFFKYKCFKSVLQELINSKKIKNGMFVLITLDEKSKKSYGVEILSNAIEQAVRGDDIVCTLRGGKFVIILPNENKFGVFTVVNKIQNYLSEKIKIRAGIAQITNKSLTKIEKEIYSALADAIQSNETVVYLEEKVNNNYLNTVKYNDKKFKLFQNAYVNKLEKVITPAFLHLQKIYEKKLVGTKIEQYTNELQSVFSLKHKKQESCLKITYPGFSKISVNTVHAGLDSPENSVIDINLNEISKELITQLVENFVEEFKSCLRG